MTLVEELRAVACWPTADVTRALLLTAAAHIERLEAAAAKVDSEIAPALDTERRTIDMTDRCAHGVPVFEQSATSCAKCHDAALLRGLLSTYRTARRCADEADREKEEVEKRRLSAVRMMRQNRDDIAKLMGWTSTNDGTLTEKVTALADAFPMLTNGDHDQ